MIVVVNFTALVTLRMHTVKVVEEVASKATRKLKLSKLKLGRNLIMIVKETASKLVFTTTKLNQKSKLKKMTLKGCASCLESTQL